MLTSLFKHDCQSFKGLAVIESTMLMQRVLGADCYQLPPVIQRHYAIDEGQSSCLEGTMTITYPRFMYPLIWLIHLFGGLVLWRGVAVHTKVQKTAQANVLNWQRIMRYPDGKTDYFYSRMVYVAEHELIENTGFGFGLSLTVEVNHGDLVYRSNGHLWQCGRFRLTIPDWLLLGAATIREHAVSEDEFYLDFHIQHPWWGETYRYQGRFRYC
jgi:hypothetical protein